MSDLTYFIKLSPNLKDWKWYKVTNTKVFFLHLLLSVRRKDCYAPDGRLIRRGQYAASYRRLSEECGLSEDQIREAVKNLKSDGTIKTKRCSKYLIYTVENFDYYQQYLGKPKRASASE